MADTKEPPHGHLLRFFRKTGCTGILNKSVFRVKYSLITAASIIIAIIFTGIISGKEYTETEIPEEILYAINYYDSMSEKLMESLITFKLNDKIEIKKINNDLKTYNIWHVKILDDYKKFPDDDRILNALIELHKNKAEVLNDICNQIIGENGIENGRNNEGRS